jgi:O-antigen/teichoic acid export membrane protein
VLAAYGGVSLIGSLAFWTVLHRWNVRPHWRQSIKRWRVVLRESLPFAITGIATMLYTRLDLLMLSFWQGDAAAGLYGSAYRLWETLGMVPSSFLDALFPELSRSSGNGRQLDRFRALYYRGRRVLWLVIPLVVVPFLVTAPLVVRLLYGDTPGAPISARIFRLLLLAFPFTFLYLLNGHALYAIGQQRRVTVVMVLITAMNALCNALLIPRWSYWGAVGVTLASEAMLFVLLQVTVGRTTLCSSPPSSEWQKEALT